MERKICHALHHRRRIPQIKKEEPVYLYVSKGNLSRIEKWSLNNRFTVEKEFIDGTIFKLENK